jgi:hypothetical protein
MWTVLALAVVGAIHLVPIAPVFAPDTTLLVMLRHRALLAAAINIFGFLGFYALYGNPAGALRTIAIGDLVALPPLAFAAWTTLWK